MFNKQHTDIVDPVLTSIRTLNPSDRCPIPNTWNLHSQNNYLCITTRVKNCKRNMMKHQEFRKTPIDVHEVELPTF